MNWNIIAMIIIVGYAGAWFTLLIYAKIKYEVKK